MSGRETGSLKANGTLEEQITAWMHKVLKAHGTAGMTNTQQMIVDIDRIIAEAFDHAPVLEETQYQQSLDESAQLEFHVF